MASILSSLFSYKINKGNETTISGNNLAVVKSSPYVLALNNGNFVATWIQGVGGLKSIQHVQFDSELKQVGNITRVNTGGSQITQDPQGVAQSNGNYIITWGAASREFKTDGTSALGSAISVPNPAIATANNITATIASSSLQLSDSIGNTIGNSVVIGTNLSRIYSFSSAIPLPTGDFAIFGVDSTAGNVVTEIFSPQLDTNNQPTRRSNETTISNYPYPHNGAAVAASNGTGAWVSLVASNKNGLEYNVTTGKFSFEQSFPQINPNASKSSNEDNNTIIIGAGAAGGAALIFFTAAYLFKRTKLGNLFRKLCGTQRKPEEFNMEVKSADSLEVNTTASLGKHTTEETIRQSQSAQNINAI